MTSDPSNSFKAAPGDPSELLKTPFKQRFEEPQSLPPFQQEKASEIQGDRFPEERQRKKISLPAFSKDIDLLIEEGQDSPIRLLEPMEGFAIPSKLLGAPKFVSKISKRDKHDPLVMPAPFGQSAPKRATEPDISISPDLVSPPQSVEERRLVLRAIFGVAHDLDRNEILRRASKLAGIVSVKLLGRAERAALSVLRNGLNDLGHSADLLVVSKEASVELIHGQATTLVVFYKGDYHPGVREILTIVAREILQID